MLSWLRRNLKIDDDIENIKVDMEACRNSYYSMRNDVNAYKALVVTLQAELAELKRMINVPPTTRLEQLKSGLNILTSFANELQRDIDRAAP